MEHVISKFTIRVSVRESSENYVCIAALNFISFSRNSRPFLCLNAVNERETYLLRCVR